jgi:hypothetical protein
VEKKTPQGMDGVCWKRQTMISNLRR